MIYTRYFNRRTASLYSSALNKIAKAARYNNAPIDELPHIFVIFDMTTPVAFAGLACYRGNWCLRACVVHPKYRGKGFQRALIQSRFDFLTAREANHVNVWVNPENTYSLNNLIEEGFRFVAGKPRDFKGKTHVKLRKNLC